MKLPLNETNANEDPSEPDTENENPTDGGGDAVVEHQTANGTRNESDFSEYMWMEHEDDYDREVLKELHEEETMNYYCDLFEEAQANGPLRGNHRLIALNPPPEPTLEIRNGIIDGLSDRFSRVINFPSRLNPEAPEFIPRLTTPTRQPPTAEELQSIDQRIPYENPNSEGSLPPPPEPST